MFGLAFPKPKLLQVECPRQEVKSMWKASPSTDWRGMLCATLSGQEPPWLSLSLPQDLRGEATLGTVQGVPSPSTRTFCPFSPYRLQYVFPYNPLWHFCRLLILLFKLQPEIGNFWMEMKYPIIIIPWERQFYNRKCMRGTFSHKPKAKILYLYFFLSKVKMLYLDSLGKSFESSMLSTHWQNREVPLVLFSGWWRWWWPQCEGRSEVIFQCSE